jgi:CheY-like chemotaxis protein
LTALSNHVLPNKLVMVRDGAQALDFLYRKPPFPTAASADPMLLLLDLKMPKVDGLEVLKIVKSDAYLKWIPVVMLSSSRVTADLIDCYGNGANAFVVKPVDPIDFERVVRRLAQFWVSVNETAHGAIDFQVRLTPSAL